MASSQKNRCDCPSFAAVPTQLEPTTKRIWVRTRSHRPSGFLSDALCASTFCSARCRSVVTTIGSNVDVDLMPLLGRRFLWRRPLVSKLTVPNLAAGVSDVTANSQSDSAKQNHGNEKRRGRFRPLHRRSNRRRAQESEAVEEIDEILGAISMFIEPSAAVVVCHRQDAIVTLFAELVDR